MKTATKRRMAVAVAIGMLADLFAMPALATQPVSTIVTDATVDGFQIVNGVIEGYDQYLKPAGTDEYGIATLSLDTPSTIGSEYVEFHVNDNGRFTIGNREGRSDTDNDDYKILLYGHPNPRTSYTTVVIDGQQYIFNASSVTFDETEMSSTAMETIRGIEITQRLQIVQNSENGVEDTVRISYSAKNTTDELHTVGFRIMLDTMLGYNDGAPFKIPGIGNVTSELELVGNEIPRYWQAYDSLTNASVFAVGTFFNTEAERPDKVQFAKWPTITDIPWDYHVTSGMSVTGDSAVAMYWNEQPVSNGSSLAVTTSYGVGYADNAGTQIQEAAVSNGQFGIMVFDTQRHRLSGVTVAAGNRRTTTDENGLAIFNLNGLNEFDKQLEVTKDGYGKIRSTVDLVGGTVVSIVLPDANGTSIISVTADYDGKQTDLLSEYLTFSEYKEDIDPDHDTVADISGKLKIDVGIANAPQNAVYQLMQGTKTLAESHSPSFELYVYEETHDASSTYRYPYLKDFKAGKDVELVITSDGNTVLTRKIALRIASAGSYFDGIMEESAVFDSKLKFTIPSEVPIIGNSELEIGADAIDLPIVLGIDDGKLKIGYNIKPEILKSEFCGPNDKQKKHEYYKALEDAKEGDYSGLDKFLDKKRLNYGSKFVKGSIEVVGYGEMPLPTTGDGVYPVSINVTVTAKINGEATYQTFVWIVPVYVKVEGNIKGSIDGNVNFRLLTEPRLSIDRFALDVAIKLSGGIDIGAGVGFSGAFSVGVGGGGEASIEQHLNNGYTKMDATLKAFLEAYLTPFVHYKQNFAEHTWNLYEAYEAPGARSIMTDDAEGSPIYNLSNYTFLNLDDIQPYSDVFSNPNDIIIDDNTMGGSIPKVVPGENGDSIVFYLAANGQEGNANVVMTKVASSSNADRETVTLPEIATGANAVRANETLTTDLYYDVYHAGNKTYLAVSATSVSIPESTENPDAEDIQDFLAGADIYLYELDTKNMTVTKARKITSDDKADLAPKIFASGGTVYVAWQTIDKGILFEDDAEYSLSLYDTAKAEILSDKSKGYVYGFDVGALGNRAVVVYAADTDGKLDTADDVELFAFDGAHVTQLTNNSVADLAPVFDEVNGRLFWYSEGNIMVTSALGGGTVAIASGDGNELAGPSIDYNVISGNNKTMIVWEAIDQNTGMTSIYASEEKGDQWSPALVLYRGEDYVTSAVDGFISKNGVTLAHINTENPDGNDNPASALILTPNIQNVDIKIVSATYDTDSAELGETLPIEVTVANAGNTPIKEFEISVDDTTETFSKRIDPGTSVTVTMEEFMIPETLEGRTEFIIQAQATEVGTSDGDTIENPLDSYPDDNIVTFELGIADLAVNTSLEVINDEDYLNVTVTNYSYMPSGARLRLLADSQDGAVLYEKTIEKVDPHSSLVMKLRLKDITAGVNIATVYATVTANADEDILDDNTSCITVDDSIARYRLTVNATTGGFVNQTGGSYPEGTNVHLTAEAYTGYKFTGWTSSIEGVLANASSAETTVVMPADDVTITANFEPENTPQQLYKLTVNASEGGSVNTTGGSFVQGATVTIKATANAGYKFTGWISSVEGVLADASSAETTVVIPAGDVTITANFELENTQQQLYKLTVNAAEGGSVNTTGGSFAQGTTINIKAIANSDYEFSGWASSVEGVVKNTSAAETTITMPPKDVTVTAVFRAKEQSSEDSEEESEHNIVTGNSILDGGTWKRENGKWRLRRSDSQYARSQWAFVNGKWYLFDESGYMTTGWQRANGIWYYLDPVNGDMQTGWIFINGTWYYLDPVNGDMKTGWIFVNGLWYYLDPTNGDMKTGWILIKGVWYYLDPINGDMKTGWVCVDDCWYYLDPTNGDMKTGWQLINGFWYYFNPISDGTKGRLLVNTLTPDGYQVNAEGRWIQ